MEDLPTTPPDDDFHIRCPRLGHQISFSYCRIENNGLPCFKSLNCWYSRFQVEAYFRQRLTEDEWFRAFSGPTKPKVLSLLELIEQAKKAG